jgi:hypothetical protein
MGPTISWILLASLAFIKFLVLDVLGVEYLSLAMFGFALCWPIVKTDSRSSTTLLYTVYLGSLISTLLYGYAAFMTHNNPRMSLFWAISLATVALLIVLMSTQDGMQVGLAILPIVLSLSVFMVANFVIIRQYIESCVVAARNLLIRSFESCLHATGACFIGLGRRWCRTSTSDEDVERAESEEDEDMELLTPA